MIVFQVYLRNTKRICGQHNSSLKNVNNVISKVVVLSCEDIPDNGSHSEGFIDTEMKLEDED